MFKDTSADIYQFGFFIYSYATSVIFSTDSTWKSHFKINVQLATTSVPTTALEHSLMDFLLRLESAELRFRHKLQSFLYWNNQWSHRMLKLELLVSRCRPMPLSSHKRIHWLLVNRLSFIFKVQQWYWWTLNMKDIRQTFNCFIKILYVE